MEEMQLTAKLPTINPAALCAPNAPKPAAVVRHVSAGFGHKQVVAFLLDTDLPDGTQLVPAEGVMAWMRGALDGNHGYRVTSDSGAHSHDLGFGAHCHRITSPSGEHSHSVPCSYGEGFGAHTHDTHGVSWLDVLGGPHAHAINTSGERAEHSHGITRAPSHVDAGMTFEEYHLGKPVQAAPRELLSDELLAIYNGLKAKAAEILRDVEPGSHADAILVAYGRAVLKAAGVSA